jgi:long-chain alkane monooxygenase
MRIIESARNAIAQGGQRQPGISGLGGFNAWCVDALGPNEQLRYIENDAVQSATKSLTIAGPTKAWTIAEIADWVGIGGLGPLLVGSVEQVADQLQQMNKITCRR